ncbi:hypothetical protein AAMO2058_001556300 [Amorphochlora amoebiformis]|uniref:Uncharacterized protein n=1 Tax=Amorphochlora amoebiformis TaxID=1561963 RepID=A0A7S0CZZ9_9EUKA
MSAPAVKQAVRTGSIAGGNWLKRSEIKEHANLLFGQPKDQKAGLKVHKNATVNDTIIAIGTNMASQPSVQEAFMKAYKEEVPIDIQKSIEDKLLLSDGPGIQTLESKESRTAKLLQRAQEAANDSQAILKAIIDLEDEANTMDRRPAEISQGIRNEFIKRVTGVFVGIPKAILSMLDRMISAIWPRGRQPPNPTPKDMHSPVIMAMAVNVSSLLLTMSLIRRVVAPKDIGQFGTQMHDLLAFRCGQTDATLSFVPIPATEDIKRK